MNINDLTIGQAKELAEFFCQKPTGQSHAAIGKKCIIRTYASGVHFGEVVSVSSNDGRSRCEIKNARRIRYWTGAFTLSEMSQSGIDKNNSKVATTVPQHFIEDAIEFITCSEDAINCIESVKDYDCK